MHFFKSRTRNDAPLILLMKTGNAYKIRMLSLAIVVVACVLDFIFDIDISISYMGCQYQYGHLI